MARTGQQMRIRTAKAMADRQAGSATTRTARTEGSNLGDKLRYRFDNSMSRGTPALIAWLFAATVVLVLVFAVLVTVFRLPEEGNRPGFFRQLFNNLLHALDPGTIGGDNGPW